MNTAQIDFYFDYVSPTSHLAWQRLKRAPSSILDRLNFRPMLLGGVFASTNNTSPMNNKNKSIYIRHDLERTARMLDVPFRFNSKFPFNSVRLMRGALAAQATNCLIPYSDAIFNAAWTQDIDVTSDDGFSAALNGTQLDANQLYSLASSDAIKEALKDATAEAVNRGVFGAPTFFVGKEMYFGQDRVDEMIQYALE